MSRMVLADVSNAAPVTVAISSKIRLKVFSVGGRLDFTISWAIVFLLISLGEGEVRESKVSLVSCSCSCINLWLAFESQTNMEENHPQLPASTE